MTTREITAIIENVVNRMKRCMEKWRVQKVEECGTIEY